MIMTMVTWEKRLSTKSLTNFLNNINYTTDRANENKPNFEGTTKAKRDIYNMISSRKEMDWEKKFPTRRSNLCAFIKNKINSFSEYEPIWLFFECVKPDFIIYVHFVTYFKYMYSAIIIS